MEAKYGLGLAIHLTDASKNCVVAKNVYLSHPKGEKKVASKLLLNLTEGVGVKISVTTYIPDECPSYAGVSICHVAVKIIAWVVEAKAANNRHEEYL